MPSKSQKGLDESQMNRLSKISSQRRGGMVRHANAKRRTRKHNNVMIREVLKGKRVPEAHQTALKEVGL